MKTVPAVLLTLMLGTPSGAGAQDRWLGTDKAKHFGAATGVAAGGYAAAVPLTRQTRWRIVLGTTAGLGVAAGREFHDRSRGTSSWRDFTWGAAGTAAGVLLAWTIDTLTD